MTMVLLPAMLRSLLEPHLPAGLEICWHGTLDEAMAHAPRADIAWLDMFPTALICRPVIAATRLKWLNSLFAGVDFFPLDTLRDRGTVFTNGVGINAIPVAEYAVTAMLMAAKGMPDIVRAQDRHEWLRDSPGKQELFESRVLIVGMGAIGSEIAARLRAFGADVIGVRRTPAADQLRPDEWRAHLADFDWVVVAAPATPDTAHMIGRAELDAMKSTAWLVNIARGSLVDQDALVAALHAGTIGGACLDVTTPEPLPPEDPLWSAPRLILSSHMSGRAQTRMFERAARLFLDNLNRYVDGAPLANRVDLTLGY